jgi:glycerol-3-phosphate dehydrogenase
MKPRPEAWRDIESQAFDVCVIGGGATGAGCALDAQLRGFNTVLVEARDFASGTSSASTKLAHGGVRYLQQAITRFDKAQFRLVQEALRERKVMLANAPHLAEASDFLIPCFRAWEVWYYELGLKLYDRLAGSSVLGPSRVLTRDQALARLPKLRRGSLHGAVVYKDGQFDDARYCLALVKGFTDAGGAAINYCKVGGFEKRADGTLAAALVEDALTGAQISVRAQAFVNATGPFSDSLRLLADPQAQPRLVLSKGAHILLPLREGPAMLIPKTKDGRVIFAIPWMDRLLVGTTDELVQDTQEVSVTQRDADYLLSYLNHYSTHSYSRADIVSAFAGVRPLVRSKLSRSTKDLIREHEVEVGPTSVLISILGGKWTSYRAMAEDTINVVEQKLGRRGPCRTSDYRLPGSEGYRLDLWRSIAADTGLPEATARHLAHKYGSEAYSVLALMRERPEWKTALVPDAAPIQAEVVYGARQEMAMSVEDVLARRLGLQFYSWELALKAAPDVAELLGNEWNWSEDWRWRAAQDYVGRLQRLMRALQGQERHFQKAGAGKIGGGAGHA